MSGAVGAAVLLAGACATSSSIPVVTQVPVAVVTPLSSELPSRVLMLARVILDVPKGTIVGERWRGHLCERPEKLVWQSEPRGARRGVYHQEFEQIVTANGFRMPGKPTSLFEPVLTGAELVIAAKITDVSQNSCLAVDAPGSRRQISKGSVRFRVHWEVYAVAEKRVVVTLQNEGSAVRDEFLPVGEDSYYVRAFGNALRGLLSNDEFRKWVTSFPFRHPPPRS